MFVAKLHELEIAPGGGVGKCFGNKRLLLFYSGTSKNLICLMNCLMVDPVQDCCTFIPNHGLCGYPIRWFVQFVGVEFPNPTQADPAPVFGTPCFATPRVTV